jgi:hypothetical protein
MGQVLLDGPRRRNRTSAERDAGNGRADPSPRRDRHGRIFGKQGKRAILDRLFDFIPRSQDRPFGHFFSLASRPCGKAKPPP